MDLPQIVAHGRSELRLAELVLEGHTPAWHGLCSCLRPQPCPAKVEWQAHADHWRTRLALLESQQPTTVMPTLACPRAEQADQASNARHRRQG